MKRYVSLFALWTRQCVYKFFLLLLAMAAAEAGLFCLQINAGKTLEQALEYGRLGLAFGTAFFLLCFLLCATGCQGSGKLGYTLSRLRVSGWAAFICHWLHNSVYFFLLWFAQTGIMLGLCQLHKYVTGLDYGPQAVLLASYRVELFHSLLPLADWGVYVCNALMALALGAATAHFSALERRGARGKAVIILAAVSAGGFTRGMSTSGNGLLGLFSVLMMAWCAVRGMGILKEGDDETA